MTTTLLSPLKARFREPVSDEEYVEIIERLLTLENRSPAARLSSIERALAVRTEARRIGPRI